MVHFHLVLVVLLELLLVGYVPHDFDEDLNEELLPQCLLPLLDGDLRILHIELSVYQLVVAEPV